MRLRKPGSKPFRGVGSERRARLGEAGRGVAAELVAIAGEMVRIPAALYMRAAEAAGRAALAGWLLLWPLLQAAWRLTARVFRVAEREVTPMRAALAVTATVALALALSQFADYRAIAIGTPEYIGVDQVASAPEVEESSGGSAHAWVGLPLALATLAVVAACAAGRRVALLLVPIGLIVVAVSVFIDAPKGLDEGTTAVAYEGAKATLLGGFWVQLACGALLVALGPLINNLFPPGELRRSAASWLGASRGGAGLMAHASRAEKLLPWACVAAAVLLFASQLMTLFEFTPPGGEPLDDRTVLDHHGPTLLIIAVFAVIAVVVSVWAGSKPAAIAVAAMGGLALLIFLLIDLPDAGQVGTLNDARQSFIDAEAIPQPGFWLEMVGALALAFTGAALATMSGEQLASLRPGAKGDISPPAPLTSVSDEPTRAEAKRESA